MEQTFEGISDRKAARSPEARAHLPLESDGAKQSSSTQRALSALAILGFALPIAAYFWLIHHYGVNTIFADQWYNVDLIRHGLSFSTLWAQHSEHRLFVPNLIVLLLAHTTHLNILFEEYLSGVMLCVAIGLLILADKRSSQSTPWIYYCPVAFVLLSFAQAGSTLFGFQLSWYLAMLAFAVALFLLDRADLTKLALAGSIAAAVVGSLSAFEGLFIWPLGLVVLYHRRCSRGLVLAWIASAVVTGAAYFHNYNFAEGNSYWFTHPTLAIRFFFLAIGDVVGAQLPDPHTGNVAVLVLGVVIFAVACWVVVTRSPRRSEPTGSSVGVALICFGLLFVATFTAGRVNGGLSVAGKTQYTTFDLLIVVGCYLALLSPSTSQLKERRSEWLAWPILRMVIAGVVILTIVFGTINGLTVASGSHQSQMVLADITANIQKAPDGIVEMQGVFQSPAWIRKEAQFAETDRLSLFATAAAATYRKEGLPPAFSILSTEIIVPANGAKLSGTAALDALSGDDVPVTKVTFHLSGGSRTDELIGTATATCCGWVYRWRTTSVANGTYTLWSEAYIASGKHSYSSAITITVKN
jgi:Bacterial Ig domain